MGLVFKVSDERFNAKENIIEINENNTYILKYPCEESGNQSHCVPYESFFPKGIYIVKCYGASGGSASRVSNNVYGGKGGYSEGVIRLNKPTKLFFFIGGKGVDGENFKESLGGYNGGGIGGKECDGASDGRGTAGGGGGATDIRRDQEDLNSRIIVAGGGGGAATSQPLTDGYLTNGGYGGGLEGESTNNTNSNYGKGAEGGKQDDSGGKAYNQRGATNGIFGYGGNGSTNYNAWPGGGGGGGWYGGGGGSSSQDHGHGWGGAGAGGSGYLSDIVMKGQTINGSVIGNIGSGYIEIIAFPEFSSYIVFLGKCFHFIALSHILLIGDQKVE